MNEGVARGVDLLIASALIVLTLRLMVIVAIAIKLDSPGPVLSKREQWGTHDHKFQLYSFRTEKLAPLGSDRYWNRLSVTPIGAFLCWTRIDSLPQLINVLRGDLTIIGTGRRRPDFAD